MHAVSVGSFWENSLTYMLEESDHSLVMFV